MLGRWGSPIEWTPAPTHMKRLRRPGHAPVHQNRLKAAATSSLLLHGGWTSEMALHLLHTS